MYSHNEKRIQGDHIHFQYLPSLDWQSDLGGNVNRSRSCAGIEEEVMRQLFLHSYFSIAISCSLPALSCLSLTARVVSDNF